MSETMAKVAAHNIAGACDGRRGGRLPLSELAAICVLDAGNNGIVFKADQVLAPDGGGGHARVMAGVAIAIAPREPTAVPAGVPKTGPQAHWAKLAFERYFLASRKRGLVTV